MYSDLQHKGPFGFVQNAEKIVQVACFFFSRRHPMRKIKPPYILPARTRTWSSSHFYSLYIKLCVILRWSDWHPYPPLPFKHFKGFPSSAICPSRVRNGGHFYHSMRVLFSWAQLGPEHEITLPCWYLWQMWSAKAQESMCVCTISSGSRSLTKFKVDEDSSQIKSLDNYERFL